MFLVCLVGLLALSSLTCSGNELGNLMAPDHGDLTHAPAPRGPFDARQRAACGPGGLTQVGLERLGRTPYLQRVTAESADILYTTLSDEPVRVEVRDPAGALVTQAQAELVPDADPGLHIARLSGLPADATLCYQILGASAWNEPTGMRTAPLAGSGAPVRLVAFGDVGQATTDQLAVLSQLRTVAFDAALITGDLAYESGRRDELQRYFFDVYADLMARTTFFPAAGNHDHRTEDGQPFRDAFALFENGGPEGQERWYSLDWGDVHIVVLDTEELATPQTSWLRADLEQNTLPWVIAVAHRPPFSSGHHGSALDVQQHLVPVLDEFDVDIALFGHEHSYERTVPIGGVTYVITGGGGRGTRPVGTSPFTAFSAPVAHFVYIVVQGDTLTLYAIDAVGGDFDTLQLERRAVWGHRTTESSRRQYLTVF